MQRIEDAHKQAQQKVEDAQKKAQLTVQDAQRQAQLKDQEREQEREKEREKEEERKRHEEERRRLEEVHRLSIHTAYKLSVTIGNAQLFVLICLFDPVGPVFLFCCDSGLKSSRQTQSSRTLRMPESSRSTYSRSRGKRRSSCDR